MVSVRGYERPDRKDFCSPFVVEDVARGDDEGHFQGVEHLS